jgi:hypothetical protein
VLSSIEQKMNFLVNKRYPALVLLLVGLVAFTYRDYVGETKPIPLATALLVPDDVPLDGHYVQMWLAAAQEDGIKLKTIHSSQWVESVARYGNTWEGAILRHFLQKNIS